MQAADSLMKVFGFERVPTCAECGRAPQWLMTGQFFGDIPLCQQHAEANGLADGDSSHCYWSELPTGLVPQEARPVSVGAMAGGLLHDRIPVTEGRTRVAKSVKVRGTR